MHFSQLFSSYNFRKKNKKKNTFPVHLKNNIKKKVLPLKPWKVGFYLLILSYHSSVAVPAASPPLSLSSTYLIYKYYLLLCFRFVLGFQWGSNSAKIEVSYSLRLFLFLALQPLFICSKYPNYFDSSFHFL